jgi:hypothetical protein
MKSTAELIRLLKIKDDLEHFNFYYSNKMFEGHHPYSLDCRIFGNLSLLSKKESCKLADELNEAIKPVVQKYINEIDREITKEIQG